MEADAVPRMKQKRRAAIGFVRFHRTAADQIPSAGCFRRIDPGLPGRDLSLSLDWERDLDGRKFVRRSQLTRREAPDGLHVDYMRHPYHWAAFALFGV